MGLGRQGIIKQKKEKKDEKVTLGFIGCGSVCVNIFGFLFGFGGRSGVGARDGPACAQRCALGRCMRRGEVWWAHIDKRRPVVLLSRDEAYAVRALVIVAPVSTTVRGLAVEVKVGKAEGLPRQGVINCDYLVTIPKTDLVERAGSLNAGKLVHVGDALRFALGLE